MRKPKEILRLKYGCAMSHRQIAKSLFISAGTVYVYANRAAQLGISSWPLDEKSDDAMLTRSFMTTQAQAKPYTVPDWAVAHQALKHKTMTLQLLWEEYAEPPRGALQLQPLLSPLQAMATDADPLHAPDSPCLSLRRRLTHWQ